ncbi:hypothetical protein ACHAWF_018292 [Thalassiosira exigua]
MDSPSSPSSPRHILGVPSRDDPVLAPSGSGGISAGGGTSSASAGIGSGTSGGGIPVPPNLVRPPPPPEDDDDPPSRAPSSGSGDGHLGSGHSSGQDNNDPPPKLIRQSSDTAVYRTAAGDVGIKVLVAADPTEEHVLRLVHEHRISRSLPPHCRRREIIDVKGFKGDPAVYFRWARGDTLDEWMRKQERGNSRKRSSDISIDSRRRSGDLAFSPSGDEGEGAGPNARPVDANSDGRGRASAAVGGRADGDGEADGEVDADLIARVKVAIAIAETLRDFHEGGFLYNNLSPSDVVIDVHEGNYTATFVDLSEAVIFYDRGAEFRRSAAETDLRRFGLMLKRLFRGGNWDDDDDEVATLSPWDRFSAASAAASVTSDGRSLGSQHRLRSPSPHSRSDRKEDPSTRKRGKGPNASGEGLPMYLGTLANALLLPEGGDAGGNPCGSVGGRAGSSDRSPPATYASASDVLSDLRAALKNPRAFLRPPVLDDALVRGRLKLPEGAFYGRHTEVGMLCHALGSATTFGGGGSGRGGREGARGAGGPAMMACVSGGAGTGKTSLVNQIQKPLREAGGYMICGKFESRSKTTTAVVFEALDAFYANLIAMSSGEEGAAADVAAAWAARRDVRRRVLADVGSAGCRALARSIPSLGTFLGDLGGGRGGSDDRADAEAESDGLGSKALGPAAAEQRWKYLLCKLVAATSSEGRPLVIFWDDLHWADETSLDIIWMMITDPDIRHCLFVVVYRDNESAPAQRLKELLHGMQEQGVSLISIKIGPIDKECVNSLVSEALCLPPSLSQPLSSIVHNKTGGIALFVTRFLKSLNEEGLLWFNLSSRRWEYDSHGIEQKEISEDVVVHMSERMTRLPHGMQSGLKLSACLGSIFDVGTLEKGISENEFDIDEFLRFAVEGGYLRVLSPGKFMWAHDQIQQAAYQLIPEEKRESFHLLLGSRMFLRSTLTRLDSDLFAIVGNMNVGARLIRSRDQRLEVARLNLTAGEMAMASSSFNGAASYLMRGVALLPDDSWREDYDLTMRLYDAATEALFITGDFEALSSMIQIPLMQARCFEDKLNSYHILIRYLVASGQMRQGIAKCISVVAQLGEIIPDPAGLDSNIYTAEVQLVKRSLTDLSEEDLLTLPLMTDKRTLVCMQFMNHILTAAYSCEPLLAPILVFRMVRLSVSQGVSDISAFAFGLYGAWLVSAINSDFEGGYRMGRLAIALMNRLGATEFIPRVYTSVYAFINIWKEPFQTGLAKHLEGYDAGVLTGDMEFSINCLYNYSACALNNCGEELAMLESHVRLYIRRAIQCKQRWNTKFLLLIHDQILQLIGSSESSFSIFSHHSEENMYQEALQNREVTICRFVLYKRKFLAFFYGDMDTAAALFEMSTEFPIGANARMSHICISILIDGLIAFFFARKHREDEGRWQNIGEAVIDLTRQWATSSEWNFINKVYLLEAEYFFWKNDQVKAVDKYDQSIKAAHNHRFVHEEGLAYERAAQFHLHHQRNNEAVVCLTMAKKCYEDWGAHGLVNRIEQSISKLV